MFCGPVLEVYDIIGCGD